MIELGAFAKAFARETPSFRGRDSITVTFNSMHALSELSRQ